MGKLPLNFTLQMKLEHTQLCLELNYSMKF